MKKPSIGRIVIFKNYLGVEHAAIITHVWNSTTVNLKAFGKDHNSTDMVCTSCCQGDGQNQWNWPVIE